MNTNHTVRAALLGIVIGAGLLMTGCSSTPTDPATKACGILADAQNATLQAGYQYTHGSPGSGSDALSQRGPRAVEAFNAAPASLANEFRDASVAAGLASAFPLDYHYLLGAETSIDVALKACVKAGVPVETVDSSTGQTSQMSG